MTSTTIEALLSLSRSIELSIVVKATVLLACGLAVARLASRAPASVRHLLLAATFSTLIALPLVVAVAPDVTIQLSVDRPDRSISPGADATELQRTSPIPSAGVHDTGARSNASRSISLASAARWGWAAGTTILCLTLAIAVWRVRDIRRHGLPWPELRERARALAREGGIRRPIDVLEHEELLAPLTCGLRHPAIVLPSTAREWDDADVERALTHELEHVRRGDWVTQLAARLVCACYWFHPLVWSAMRRMSLEAERACDDAVVRRAERTDYANQLVLLARRLSATHAPAMLGMANRSDLSARVNALLDEHQPRGRAGLFAAISAAVAAALAVTAIAPVRAVAKADDIVLAGEPSADEGQRRRVRAIDRALYEAAEGGDVTEVDQLLQAGANLNAAVDGDGSPLIGAARSGRISLVRHLLDRGADVNMPVPGDGSPLIVAAGEGALSIVELLLDRGAAIDQIVPGDETALIQASGEGHLEVVKLLVSRGANVNLGVWVERSDGESQRREWRSPLSMARRGRHTAVVEFLLTAGAQ